VSERAEEAEGLLGSGSAVLLNKAHQRRPCLLSCRRMNRRGLRAQARLEVCDQRWIQLQGTVLGVKGVGQEGGPLGAADSSEVLAPRQLERDLRCVHPQESDRHVAQGPDSDGVAIMNGLGRGADAIPVLPEPGVADGEPALGLLDGLRHDVLLVSLHESDGRTVGTTLSRRCCRAPSGLRDAAEEVERSAGEDDCAAGKLHCRRRLRQRRHQDCRRRCPLRTRVPKSRSSSPVRPQRGQR
jgi:hypothetical protein